MRHSALMRFAFGAAVLMVVILALTACGRAGEGGQEQAKAKEQAKGRSLPQDPQALRPGQYHSVKFKPALSFTVGKGWSYAGGEASDLFLLGYGGIGGLGFLNVKEVFKPTSTELVEPPEDLAGWLQHHPYLKTTKPEPITVGGAKGLQFDVVVGEDLPKGHSSVCGTDCVDIFNSSTSTVALHQGDKVHSIILEDVEGETVYIDYGSDPTNVFDKLAPEAQKLVESVKWAGS